MKPDAWRRISEIVASAIELEEEARAGYLDEACAGDTSLRAEVERLLGADARAGSFLERPPLMQILAESGAAQGGAQRGARRGAQRGGLEEDRAVGSVPPHRASADVKGQAPSEYLLRFPGMSTSGLPKDLLEAARRRLTWACFIYAGAWLCAWGLPRVFLYDETVPIARTLVQIQDVVAVASIALAALLAILLRSSLVRTPLLLDLGLVFEVVGAFGIATSEWWSFYSPERVAAGGGYVDGLSWVYIWVLFFPAVVPATRGKALLATVTSGAMPLIVLYASHANYRPELPDGLFLKTMIGYGISGLVCVGMAMAIALIVHGLGRKVSEARRLGSYRLVRLLGEGGMGEVWLARHRLLARPAAVKLVRREALQVGGSAASDRVLERFEREAQTTAQLRCPHTINLYDFGIAADGTFYYAMELLQGLNLEDLVDRFGPLRPERVAHLLRQTCRSLEEAHQHGLIHRDIKPANIFCCRYGLDFDFAKVLDFGLIKTFVDLDPVGTTTLTAESTVAGTPAYMAPEVVLAESEVDARADIYALGCVAYWLATGVRVFEAKSPMRLAMMHVDTPPVPPSKRSEIEIPRALDELILDCLAKDPDDRPQSAPEIARRLDACVFDEPWSQERARLWWTRHAPEVCHDGVADAVV